jgi:hypothetical protein
MVASLVVWVRMSSCRMLSPLGDHGLASADPVARRLCHGDGGDTTSEAPCAPEACCIGPGFLVAGVVVAVRCIDLLLLVA